MQKQKSVQMLQLMALGQFFYNIKTTVSGNQWHSPPVVSVTLNVNMPKLKRKLWLGLKKNSLGKSFLFETNHKPFVPLLGSKRLDSLPPRVLCFHLRLTRFQYSICHVPGKTLYMADTLSRAPINTFTQEITRCLCNLLFPPFQLLRITLIHIVWLN